VALSDQAIIAELVGLAKEKGEFPTNLTREQTISFVDELENRRDSSPIYIPDQEDSSKIRVHVTNPSIMDKYVQNGEVDKIDHVYWYRVGKDFFQEHPEVATALTPRTWIPVFNSPISVNGEIKERKEYFDEETQFWKAIEGSEKIGNNWQKLLDSEAALEEAQQTGAFVTPTGQRASELLLLKPFKNNKDGYLPMVMLDPRETSQLVEDPRYTGDTFGLVPMVIILNDQESNFFVGRKVGIADLIWLITEGGNKKEVTLVNPNDFQTNTDKKLLEKGGIYYTAGIGKKYADENILLDPYEKSFVPSEKIIETTFDLGKSVKNDGLLVFANSEEHLLIKLPNA
jgi:hypothetical protein